MIELLKDWPKGEPVPAISIRQPWASLVAWGFKDVENRSNWRFGHRGPLIVHSSARTPSREEVDEALRLGREDEVDPEFLELMAPDDYKIGFFSEGAIIGVVKLTEVLGPESEIPDDHYAWASPWASEDVNYWLCLDDVVPVEPVPYKGRVGLFKVPWEVASTLEVVRDDE